MLLASSIWVLLQASLACSTHGGTSVYINLRVCAMYECARSMCTKFSSPIEFRGSYLSPSTFVVEVQLTAHRADGSRRIRTSNIVLSAFPSWVQLTGPFALREFPHYSTAYHVRSPRSSESRSKHSLAT